MAEGCAVFIGGGVIFTPPAPSCLVCMENLFQVVKCLLVCMKHHQLALTLNWLCESLRNAQGAEGHWCECAARGAGATQVLLPLCNLSLVPVSR